MSSNFQAAKPNETWVSDITLIPVDGEWLDLAVIMDLFSRQITGWAIDQTITTERVLDALYMEVKRHEVKPGLIRYLVRGVPYRSREYQRALADYRIRPSMSPTGRCCDNESMEWFFCLLKVV